MRLTDIIHLARRAIRSNRMRTNLTIAIIAVGITALIGIITVIDVLKETIHTNFSSMGSNTFTITSKSITTRNRHGGRKQKRSDAGQQRITLEQANWFRDHYRYPSIVSLSVLATNTAILKRGRKKSNPNVFVMGVDEQYLRVAGTSLASGRNFTAKEVGSSENTCLLGHKLATTYFGEAANAPNRFIQMGDVRYRVLGVLDSKGSSLIDRTDNMVLISLQNARQRFNLSQKSMVISVWIPKINHLDYAAEEAEGTMRQARKLGAVYLNDFSINKHDDIATNLIENLRFVTLAASVIGFITLLGAAIGLMNIMLVSVAERTREIGLSKAIGAKRNTIRWQFLSEALIISLSGGIIGILAGILIGNIISLLFHTAFVVPWIWIGIGISICILVGLMAGIYPALKAGRLNPIHALRYE